MDGGATWDLLDSTDNTLPFSAPSGQTQRDHALVGNSSYQIVVDPRPTPTGQVIVYAAMSGGNGGIWRSSDTGNTWQKVLAGQATDVILDPTSGTVDAFTNPTGNLQRVFAGIRGSGVYQSTSEGVAGSFSLMTGGVGKPLVQDLDVSPTVPVQVTNQGPTPNGAKGRIVLAKPALTGDTRQDFMYQGWLYAAVVTTNDHLDGVYLTKDYGLNWTQLRIPTLPPLANNISPRGVPTNDITQSDYDPLGNTQFAQGNYDVALAIDPTNPNVVYLGGTADGNPYGLIRIDATDVNDQHAFFLNDGLPGGAVRRNYVTGGVTIESSNPEERRDKFPFGFDARTSGTMNLYRNPDSPQGASATVYVNNAGVFANNGAGVRWTGYDGFLTGTDVHRMFTLVDPLTGLGRLVVGYDQGIATTVDNNGTFLTQVGTMTVPFGARNGNIQITQLYYGAVQPSRLAAQIAGALFYGQAQDDGFPRSSANVLDTGLIGGTGSFGDGAGVATDQTRLGHALSVQLAVLRRRRHRLLPGQRCRTNHRPDPFFGHR